ncbi:DUF4191 domain-containing protein [Dactylosporangium sp. CS-047395]|jgi:hypothetical protein|uniref:DUF4191 domain-containing protein n=1 Tax=Dactylosporangium sp. CS-047395 TaxID=3239936 RepID=UPI003D8BD4CA
MAKAQEPEKVSFFTRLKQIGMVFSFTAKRDKAFVPLVVTVVLVPLIAVGVAIALGVSWIWAPLGVLLALLGTVIVLNLRSQKAMMKEAEGQPGAAASIIENMRGDWRVSPAIASTTQFDMVHLVIGRPGVILLGEGNTARVKGLIAQERRRLVKVIGNAELRDYIVGNEEGQVPLPKIRNLLIRLPRTITAKDVNSLDKRLKALSARPQMPRGALPKNMKPPKGQFKAMRGR